jgi:hypothetical protein
MLYRNVRAINQCTDQSLQGAKEPVLFVVGLGQARHDHQVEVVQELLLQRQASRLGYQVGLSSLDALQSVCENNNNTFVMQFDPSTFELYIKYM